MNEEVLAYFSSVNPLARKIIKDEEVLRTALGDEWFNLDWQKQEELIDDYIVDETVRQKYADVPKTHDYPPSFPKLIVEPGEKIIVDFENDCWTWQDEHSAPFSWKTKSQQDLTLDDLEPDVLTKPLSKTKKKVNDVPAQDPHVVAPREFSVQSGNSIWESPFLQGVKKPDYIDRSRSTCTNKPAAASKESLASREQSPEEVNHAFTGSVDDLSSTQSSIGTGRSPSVSSGEILDASPTHDPAKYKAPKRRKSLTKSPIKISSKKSDTDGGFTSLVTKKDDEEHAFDNPIIGSVDDLSSTQSSMGTGRSPSVSSGEILDASPTHDPAKYKALKRRKSLTKSPIKISSKKSDTDGGFTSLVTKKDDEEHAFDNPIIGDQRWSKFANETADALDDSFSSSAAASPSRRLLKEPEIVVMDRGEVTGADHSVQGQGSEDSSKCLDDSGSDFQDATLVVEEHDDDAPDSQDASVLTKTGFDFLDNW